MSASIEDIIAEAIGGNKAAAFASARRRGWAQGFAEGTAGGASGALGAYVPALGAPFNIKAHIDRLRAENSERIEELAGVDGKLANTQRELNILRDVRDWIENPGRVLTKVNDSIFHKVVEAGFAGAVHYLEDGKSRPYTLAKEFWETVAAEVHVFIIQHDWASAFKSAEIGEGETKFPYNFSCFEMQINGTRVCYLGFQDEGTLGALLFIKTAHGWVGVAGKSLNDVQLPLFIAEQIRAVCVSLDAEVAEAIITRAPHRLNAARAERGRLPLFDYRVVSLAKRSRAPALNAGVDEGNRKRLHWRRGHWRHFPTFKTWIKWMLVGDPDLGFVDKHYKL